MYGHYGKRLLAWLLIFSLCLTISPSVQAADTDAGIVTEQVPYYDPTGSAPVSPDTSEDALPEPPAEEEPANGEDPIEAPAEPQIGDNATAVPENIPVPEEIPLTQTQQATGIDAFLIAPDQILCPFTDVATGKWYRNAVAYCYSAGLVNGVSSTRFSPNTQITAAEAITLSVRVYVRYHGLSISFHAAKGEAWYMPYVRYAQTNNLIPTGVTNYNAFLTRQEAAAIFYSTLPQSELMPLNKITEIPDVAQDNPYYEEILALYNAGILTGTDVYGTFRPNKQLTRAEFVQLLYKLIYPPARTQQCFAAYPGMAAFDLSTEEIQCTFTDVPAGKWFTEGIAIQQTLGLINGISATKFAPNNSVTLAEALTICVRIYRKYYGITTPIASANGAPWYTPYIRLAKEYHIAPADWTDYTAPISREQIAILIYNTLPATELTAINQITTIPDVPAAAAGYNEIKTLYQAGILTGNDQYGTYRPKSELTRAEFATLTTRLIIPELRKNFTPAADFVGVKLVYGTSGAGRELVAYRYGSGKNVMVVGFAIHGYEDNFKQDGYSLVYTAEALMAQLKNNMPLVHSGDWSVYVLPCMNPDGLYDGYSASGPGRCTTTYITSDGTLSSAGGIDMNRCFPFNFRSNTTNRNYTGPTPLACLEAQALASFIQSVKGSGTNVCIDTHGWTQQIMTSTGTDGLLYQTFRSAFNRNIYANCTFSAGFFTSYATSLGYDSCLFEFPDGINSHTQFMNSGYCEKYVSCIMTLLRKY